MNLPPVNIDSQCIDDFKIEELVYQVRDLCVGIGSEPINDLQYVFEENGIIVVGSEVTDRKMDAYSQLLTVENNETYIIVLSIGKKGKARINFDLSHELGHIILHLWTEDIETLSSKEFKERERQANKFSSSFLLPKKTFKLDVEKFPTELDYYLRLKAKWGCSIQAMFYRSNDLGVITNN